VVVKPEYTILSSVKAESIGRKANESSVQPGIIYFRFKSHVSAAVPVAYSSG
jgi:hypothetical protein